MNITALLSISLLTPAALVAAAEPALPPAAAHELAELEELYGPGLMAEADAASRESGRLYAEYSRECLGVIAHYRRTGDARHASPARRLTLLHLACSAKKPALVEQLLAQGADPNALSYDTGLKRSYDGCFTLTLCWQHFRHFPMGNREDCLRIIDLLVAAGGDPKGKQAGSALYMMPLLFASVEGAEDIALHLLKLGTDPGSTSLDEQRGEYEADPVQGQRIRFLGLAAYQGWARVVGHMLDAGMCKDIDLGTDDEPCVLCRRVARMAVEQGDADEEPYFEGRAACVALLLRHGANPEAKGAAEDSRASAADFIHSHPRLLAYLRAQGITVPRTPRELGEASLARDLRRLPSHACPPLESLTPLYGALAALLASDEADEVQPGVLSLMMQVDAARTAEKLVALPMWQPSPDWTESQLNLYKAMLRQGGLGEVLPADWLLSTAEAQEAAGFPRIAHSLIHLLAQQPQATPMVEKLCHDTRPAIAAAAWTVRLRLAGLDNLPLLDLAKLATPGSAGYEELRRLRCAVDLLTELKHDDFFFLDFRQMDNYARMRLGDEERGEADISKREAMGALVSFLRERGAGDEAAYVSELQQLYSRLHPGYTSNDGLKGARDFVLGFGKERRQERFDELTRPERVNRDAFTIEALLGRHLWELHEKQQ